MGWIVDDVVLRIRAAKGKYRAHEWERFLIDCGLRIVIVDLPPNITGMVVDDVVILQRGMPTVATARRAFHEAGHFFLHEGNGEFWRSRLGGLQGDLTVSRFERQADEFADKFPVWDESS